MKITTVAAVAAAALLGTTSTAAAHDEPAPPAGPEAQAATATMAYQPIAPIRVADTRAAHGATTIGTNREVVIDAVTAQVAAAAGVTENAVGAVVLNVTAVNPAGAGYLTVWPADTSMPLASSLNMMHPGHTVANLVTSPVDTQGRIRVFASISSDVIVDVQGVFVAAADATSGRLSLAPTPRRIYDSRHHGRQLHANSTLTLNLSSLTATQATAVVVNITVADTGGAGHLTVHPAGTTRPNASNLNYTGAGQIVANQVYATLNNGSVSIYTHADTHLIVDFVGYFTGPQAPRSSDGLFVAVTPHRILDTRTANAPAANRERRLARNETMHVPVAGRGGIPAGGAAAVAANVTITGTAGPGWVRVWPSGKPKPQTSTVNSFHANQTVANHATSAATTSGIAIETSVDTHVVADITGYFTGTPAPGIGAPGGSSDSYTLRYVADDGRTGRWNPCRPIRYALNTAHMTGIQRDALNTAIAAVEAATGLDFTPAGTTTVVPKTGNLTYPAGVDVIMAVTPHGTGPLGVDVWGVGYGRLSHAGDSDYLYTKGWAVISDRAVTYDHALQIWLHELGHVVGLGHTSDPSQMMTDAGPLPGYEYQAGDLAGLAAVGAKNGCGNYGSISPTEYQ